MAGIQKGETGRDKNVRELIMLLFFSFLSFLFFSFLFFLTAFAFACFVLGYLVVFRFLLDKIAMG